MGDEALARYEVCPGPFRAFFGQVVPGFYREKGTWQMAISQYSATGRLWSCRFSATGEYPYHDNNNHIFFLVLGRKDPVDYPMKTDK